jgi:hypothetical protein
MRTRKPCALCAWWRGSAYDARWYTLAEWDVLLRRTGIVGEWDGEPIIGALCLLRSGSIRLPGRSDAVEIAWEVLAFRCPWAPADAPKILTLPQRYEFSPAGVIYPIPHQLDERGRFFDDIGCYGADGRNAEEPCEDWLCIRPFSDPTLPRRRVGEP